jgi:Fe2+ transport system protein FeoA
MILSWLFLRVPPVIIVIDKSVPLSSLHTGQLARVSRITGQPDRVHRLEEFGLCGGTRIQMFRPGNPCILRIAAGKVCFRTDDLLQVFVELDAASG